MKHACNSKLAIWATILTGLLFLSAAAYGAGNRASRRAPAPADVAAAAGPSGYHLLKTIPLPRDTFWDYLKFQPSTRRLFISHGNHVVVVNVDTGKIIGDIGGMEGIHGIVLAPEFNRGFVTDGRAAKVWIFNLRTLKMIGSAPADKDADGEVYDPASKRVFTMNGDPGTPA